MTEVRHTVPASELARIENHAKCGVSASLIQTLGLINTIHSLSHRLQVRFNETVRARQDAAAARERAESAERQLAARGPMADLGHLADAVARAERAERWVTEFRKLLRAETYLVEAQRERAKDVAASAERERQRAETYRVRMVEQGEEYDQIASRLATAEQSRDEWMRVAGVHERARQEAIERAEREVAQARQIARVHGEAGIRERFGVKPEEDLYNGLSRRVGELQTSEAELVSAPLKKRISELEQSVQARDRLLDSSSRAVREVHELVRGEGVDRAMEDLPPYLGDESDQLSAEEVAGGYLVQVIKEVREALSDKDTPQEELNDWQSLEYQRVLTDELEQSVQVRDRLLVAFTTANLAAHHLVWAEGVTDALKYEEAVPAPDGHWKRLAQVVREVREVLSDKDTPPQAGMTAYVHGQTWTTVGGRQVQIGSRETSPCGTCSGSGWVTQEGQIRVPGSGSTHGCPDCERGRARLARGELETDDESSPAPADAWVCSVPGHSDRQGIATIERDDSEARCLIPGCLRTSSDPPSGRESCACNLYDCTGDCCGPGQCSCSPGAFTTPPADDCLRTYREVLERSGEVCNICAYSAERHPRASDAS